MQALEHERKPSGRPTGAQAIESRHHILNDLARVHAGETLIEAQESLIGGHACVRPLLSHCIRGGIRILVLQAGLVTTVMHNQPNFCGGRICEGLNSGRALQMIPPTNQSIDTFHIRALLALK